MLRVLEETSESTELYATRPHDVRLWEESVGVGAFEYSILVTDNAPSSTMTRYAAGHLVAFFQSRDHWCSFRLEEFLDFCEKRGFKHHVGQPLYGLMSDHSDRFIIRSDSGAYRVTNRFVDECMKAMDQDSFRKGVDDAAKRMLSEFHSIRDAKEIA